MAKFYGTIGYIESVETAPGVFVEQPIERVYTGDVLRNTKRWEKGEGLNDNLTINNTISIVADAYAYEHFFAIRYVNWMGSCWKVTSVEIQRPRLILILGGIYNGKENGSSQNSG